jgi:hypothetical protein
MYIINIIDSTCKVGEWYPSPAINNFIEIVAYKTIYPLKIK